VKVADREVGKNYQYLSFRFLSDGSTNLPPQAKKTGGGGGSSVDTWYVTLVGLGDETKDINGINYFTLQIDPVSGTAKAFRPNAG